MWHSAEQVIREDISELLREIERFDKEIERIDLKRRDARIRLDYAQRLVDRVADPLADPKDNIDPFMDAAVARIREASTVPFEHLSAAEAVRRILDTIGHPLPLSEIARLAVGCGFGGREADTEKIVSNFSSMLSKSVSRDDSPFVKLSRGIFGIRGRDRVIEVSPQPSTAELGAATPE